MYYIMFGNKLVSSCEDTHTKKSRLPTTSTYNSPHQSLSDQKKQ